MTADTSEWLGTTLSQGRYRVLRKLGEGGMAHVYVAHDDKLEREVVIKAPRSNLMNDSKFAGRFTREVRSLAKLAHPHIVPLIDIGQEGDVPFAVMHYLTGGSLRDRQPRDPDGQPAPAPVEQLFDWLPAIAQALDFVHKHQFVHRDVKPENILFDESGQVFLADLGIIKALSEPEDPAKRTVLTGAGVILGTPQYMAPELIMGDPVDGRVDQYALAVTVYEAVAGQVPFNGASAPAIFIQQTTKPPTPLRQLVPTVSPALADAVARALSKSPTDRFPTCVDFVRAALPTASIAGSSPRGPTTVRESLAPALPRPATVVEPSLASRETPSQLRSPTAPASAPNWRAAPPAAESRSPAPSKLPLVAALVLAVIGIGAAAAYFFLSRSDPASLTFRPVEELRVAVGEPATLRVEIDRHRVDGDVRCWIENLPEGLKAQEIVIPADKTRGTIELESTLKASAAKGTAVLKAKSGDVETQVDIPVSVMAAPASLRFAVVASQTVKAGDTTTVLVHVERHRCAGPIAVSVDNLPKGVSWHRPFFAAPVIAADQSSYAVELRADDDAPESLGWKTLVKGTLDKAEATATIPLTVVPRPATPSKTPDTTVKKTGEEKPPDVTAKIPTKKPDEKTSDEKKTVEPPKEKPKPPAELVIAAIPDVAIRAGETRAVEIRVQRRNFAGPVAISLTGLPAAGVVAEPAPLPVLADNQDQLTFNLIADPAAGDAKIAVGVQGVAGTVRAVGGFNVAVLRRTPVAPKIPIVREEILWQKRDQLADSDPLDRVRTQSRSKSFPVPFRLGKQYTIDLASDTFDPYLRIEDARGNTVVEDDDSGPGLGARLIFLPPDNGVYYLVVTSYNGNQTGAFALTIR